MRIHLLLIECAMCVIISILSNLWFQLICCVRCRDAESQPNLWSSAPSVTAADRQRLHHANVSDNSNVHHTSYYRGAGGGHQDAQSVR